ncbi:unnamed protein product [Peronospora destructor]|uniref:Uncharacterized protein n=1 Tax=Peronospora destructor TaxID=86335 RepID=A0AAV0SZ65_9STRA|nr:unnamed protein product [Peronospora destructor]CAI5711346.1 unnamed protein product [Peronospora destructor]
MRVIGCNAVKHEHAVVKCFNVLQTKVSYIVQEAINYEQGYLPQYPNQYESIIATLYENLVTLDEPKAKASISWIIDDSADCISIMSSSYSQNRTIWACATVLENPIMSDN